MKLQNLISNNKTQLFFHKHLKLNQKNILNTDLFFFFASVKVEIAFIEQLYCK